MTKNNTKLKNIISKHIEEHIQTILTIQKHHFETIQLIASILSEILNKKGTIFLCGNGGSAADSQHLAAEFVGRFKKDRRALSSIALTTDSSILTCISNDYSFEEIFSRQIEAIGREGDALIAISTSGNSKNINEAILTAKKSGLKTIALLGKDGGEALHSSDIALKIDSDSTARIQESHILIGHILCDLVEKELNLD